jgi:hypothetical protein
VNRAHRVEGVGVGVVRALVRPIALHPSESECDAARIARARLDSVERDLDDELRAK